MSVGVRRVALACTFAALLTPTGSHAQPARGMTLVELLNVPALSDPQLSPDGRQMLYVQAEADWRANRRISHVWRINTDGTAPIKLTAARQSATAPRWSSDGRTIAFVADGAGSNVAQIWLLPSDGGEASQLTTHATSVSAISWSPDGTFLYFLAPDPPSEDEARAQKEHDDVYAFE